MGLEIFILILLLFQISQSFSQKYVNWSNGFSKYHVVGKSNNPKKVAKTLFIGGASATLLSLLWFSNSQNDNEIMNDNIGGQGVLFILGSASMVASVPFFISSRNKKLKSISANIEMQKSNLLNDKGHSYYKIQPALNFRLLLGK
jgi:hypothetical protein